MITVGDTVSGYRADRVIGQGATATVFAATRLSDLRPAALKMLSATLQANATVRARFNDAARLQQSLEHPNVVGVYDVGETDGESFVAMQLARGGTLASVMQDGLEVGRALEILGQVAEALDFAHAAGVSHGDVKPRNILLEDGAALLADFGLAVALRQGAPSAAAAPGTIHYSAPERLRGDDPTPSADVYGLACVLFECLTGAVPYPHDTAAAAVGAHLFNPPPRAGEIRPGLPRGLDEILARGLAKDARDRPGSARELVSTAAAALDGSRPVPALRPKPVAAAAAQALLDDTLSEPIPVLPDPPAIDVDESHGISRPVLVGAVAVAALVAALGAWLGHLRPAGHSISDGPLAVAAPDGWRSTAGRVLPGVAIADALALVPRDQARAVTFVMGTVRGVPPTYLPASLLRRLGTPPQGTLVQFDSGVAYRYSRLAPAGYGRLLTVYVLPGPHRSGLAACSASQTTTPALLDCAEIAQTLTVRHLDVYDARPDPRFASAVNGAMRVLKVARNSGLATLRKAKTGRAQARAATGIAVAYRTTVSSIRRTRPPGITAAVARELVSSLDGAGVGYTRLARSARRGDAAAYERARALITASETSIDRSLGELRDLGYRGTVGSAGR